MLVVPTEPAVDQSHLNNKEIKMSSGIILLIVAIVLLVIIAYLVGVIIRKRNDTLITSLEERKQALFGLPVNDEIEEVKSLHLIGQSQTSFREWNQKWVDLTLNTFTDIEKHIFEAEHLNDTFNFIRAKHEINSVESQLNLVEEDITAIREALGILKEQEEKQRACYSCTRFVRKVAGFRC